MRYTIFIHILQLFIITYVFCYRFQFDGPLIQLMEDYKRIDLIFKS